MTTPTKKLVLLGMMSKIPVAGVIWQTIHYLIGFQRLGYDVYYVETHARTPTMLLKKGEKGGDRGSAKAAGFISKVMSRFGFENHWAYLALHHDGRSYGMTRDQVRKLYKSAALIINFHGGTHPRLELDSTDRLVYLETDPVLLQIELHEHLQQTLEFLEPHSAFFTFAENYGAPGCRLPVTDRFAFHPTRQPVVMDFWQNLNQVPPSPEAFTTVGNWKQPWQDITFQGETYSWSKHYEFLKFLDLPELTGQPFELALGMYSRGERAMLESKGWRVRPAVEFSKEANPYRDYIASSRGEFTVAKDQNIRLRTGWFSDRSATYLAAGRPVITQETGFSDVLPTGEGLFAFSTLEEVVAAVESVNGDYERHRKAASEVARECFSHEVVLSRLLELVGEELSGRRGRLLQRERDQPFPLDLDITPVSRRPTRLPHETVQSILGRPVPVFESRLPPPADGRPVSMFTKPASIVVSTHNNLVLTRLCLESLLANTDYPSYEVVIVDNASDDGTPDYLRQLAKLHRHVRVVVNEENMGFPRACNQGLALANGELLVLLNNDTMVPPGWLMSLVRVLDDPEVGAAGPVTNRIANNEAEIEASYRTWGECLDFARRRAQSENMEPFEIRLAAMFCFAMRRDVYEWIGPLDEHFGLGMLEDDDYSIRLLGAGYRLLCSPGVFVHHFGEGSFGALVPTGEHAGLLRANRKRLEDKWGNTWQPGGRRRDASYEGLTERIRRLVATAVPPEATVLVVSRGDDELLELDGRRAWHFPAAEDGGYAGHYPRDSMEAVKLLEAMRTKGGEFLLFPKTGLWWLDHYAGLREHLESRYDAIIQEEDTCLIFALNDKQ
jgi:GT2 family glycosyltransferase